MIPEPDRTPSAASPRKTVIGVPRELVHRSAYVTNEVKVGLTERELQFWIEALKYGGRHPRLIGLEIERAVEAAVEAGMVSKAVSRV